MTDKNSCHNSILIVRPIDTVGYSRGVRSILSKGGGVRGEILKNMEKFAARGGGRSRVF